MPLWGQQDGMCVWWGSVATEAPPKGGCVLCCLGGGIGVCTVPAS